MISKSNIVPIAKAIHSSNYLVYDTEYDGVDEPDPGHAHQAQQEEVGVPVQLEVRGLGVDDGAHQLPLGRAEAWDGSGEGGSVLGSVSLFSWSSARHDG